LVGGEALDKEKEILELVNEVYQKLVSADKETEDITDLLEKDIKEVQNL